ncbi:MAG: MFS transporter [Candidatus Hermodarchaeota archaeon]
MTEEKPSIKTSKRALFGLSAIPDQLTYQSFTILVFTFYFAVVGIPVLLVMGAYIVWGIWNALNDPLLGALSDRTKYKKRLGRRKFYLIISMIPLSLIMILLFSVPIGNELIAFIYFLVIILTFELIYTMWSVNVNSVFPEQFPTEEERAKTNIFVKLFTIIAVICASLIPTIIISPLVPTEANPTQSTRVHFQMMYLTAGLILAIIIFIAAIIFITKGVEEKEQDTSAFENRPSFKDSLKFTLRNKTFLKFTLANMCIWYCFTTLLTALPLYATWVLGIKGQTLLIGIALMFCLLIAAFVLPLHMKLGQKIGMRNGLMLTLGLWICLLFPFFLLGSNMIMLGIIIIAIQGIALGGALFYVDILIGDVIDSDEVEFGIKRSASYYGINAFIHRFSQIFSIITIALIFQGTGWSSYEPNPGTNIILGLKLIMFLFPAIALTIGILFLKLFNLHGDKLKEMRSKLEQIHSKTK